MRNKIELLYRTRFCISVFECSHSFSVCISFLVKLNNLTKTFTENKIKKICDVSWKYNKALQLNFRVDLKGLMMVAPLLLPFLSHPPLRMALFTRGVQRRPD